MSIGNPMVRAHGNPMHASIQHPPPIRRAPPSHPSSSSSALPRGGPESGPLQFRWMTFRVNVVGATRTYLCVRQWPGCRDHDALAVEILSACIPDSSLQRPSVFAPSMSVDDVTRECRRCNSHLRRRSSTAKAPRSSCLGGGDL